VGRYQKHISGSLIDRMDIHVDVPHIIRFKGSYELEAGVVGVICGDNKVKIYRGLEDQRV
jgi:hypothetical protein